MGHQRHVYWLLLVVIVAVGASIALYRLWPVAGVAAGVGMGTIAVIAMAHLGVLAVIAGPFLALRRRRRR
jgi:hypothetical protein